jgi:hypothetical protein
MASFRDHRVGRDEFRQGVSPRKRRYHEVSESDDDEFDSDTGESSYNQRNDPSDFLNTFGGYESDEDDGEDQGNYPKFEFTWNSISNQFEVRDFDFH